MSPQRPIPSWPSRRPAHRPRPRGATVALALVAGLGLAACTSASTGSTAPAASLAASPAPTSAASSAPLASAPTANASGSASPSGQAVMASNGPTAVPTAIDPCQLISAQEAGQLTGAAYGPGIDVTTSKHARICTYGANTKNVFQVIVAVAPDVATAKAAEASEEADLQANAARINAGLTVTQMPGFAPGVDAAMLVIKPNSIGVAGRSMMVLKGAVYFGFSDLVVGGAAPSADAMKAEAMTALARLP